MTEALPRLAQLSLEPLQFHPFPHLPTELRLKVWFYVNSNPREVRVTCKKSRTPAAQPKMIAESFTSNLPPPATLQVSPESRAESLEIYRPFFQTTRSECRTYVCFERDTIVMADKDISYLGTNERKGIQRMKIAVVDCANFGRYHIQTLKTMENLREVDVIMDERVMRQEVTQNGRDLSRQLQWEVGDEMRDDPAWNCPKVRIVGSDTGKLYGSLRGGVWISGWKTGDPFPEDDEVQAYWIWQTQAEVVHGAT